MNTPYLAFAGLLLCAISLSYRIGKRNGEAKGWDDGWNTCQLAYLDRIRFLTSAGEIKENSTLTNGEPSK